MFDRVVDGKNHSFPNQERRGRTLMMVADFSGQHRAQMFDTYAFLVFDLEENSRWFYGQRLFREFILPVRRMSFKTMNDGSRRRALVPFLRLSETIEGWLVLFAVSKTGGSLFDQADIDPDNRLLDAWKPSVQERLLRILHLSSFLLSGLASPHQDVVWVIDEDEVAANAKQLTQLTTVFERISSNSLSHDLGHLRCATTRSDDGTIALEDLAAISDFGAGALSEIGTALIAERRFPVGSIATLLPNSLSWKSRIMATWLGSETGSLRRLTYVVQLDERTPRIRATALQWSAFPGQVVLPHPPLTRRRS
jgi:hypothetical protein